MRAHCKACCSSQPSSEATLFELLNLIVGFDELLNRTLRLSDSGQLRFALFCFSLSFLTLPRGTASYWTHYKAFRVTDCSTLSEKLAVDHLAFSRGPDTIWQSRVVYLRARAPLWPSAQWINTCQRDYSTLNGLLWCILDLVQGFLTTLKKCFLCNSVWFRPTEHLQCRKITFVGKVKKMH